MFNGIILVGEKIGSPLSLTLLLWWLTHCRSYYIYFF